MIGLIDWIGLMGLIFIFGASVGSFINVLVYREKVKAENLKLKARKRSYCDHCKRQLLWWENIPLVSFVFLRGKCRTCHSPIPLEYPVVEFATGIIYFLIISNFEFLISHEIPNSKFQIPNNIQTPISQTQNTFLIICYLLIASLLIIVFLYDFHYQIIPDWAVIGLIGISLIGPISSIGPIRLIGIGLASTAFLFLLHLFTRGRGMGLGDVKFAFFMGIFLGWPKILVGMYIAFLTGACFGVILILLKKKKFGQKIAFGPFLVVGTFLAWFCGEKIMTIIDSLNY